MEQGLAQQMVHGEGGGNTKTHSYGGVMTTKCKKHGAKGCKKCKKVDK